MTSDRSRVEMRAATAPYATGEPQATIPARALKTGVDPTVADFRIRSWDEGEGVRVLVFAVIPTPGWKDREEQIASVFVPVKKCRSHEQLAAELSQENVNSQRRHRLITALMARFQNQR